MPVKKFPTEHQKGVGCLEQIREKKSRRKCSLTKVIIQEYQLKYRTNRKQHLFVSMLTIGMEFNSYYCNFFFF